MPASACRRWTKLCDNQEQGRRKEETSVGINGREVAENFNMAGLGED